MEKPNKTDWLKGKGLKLQKAASIIAIFAAAAFLKLFGKHIAAHIWQCSFLKYTGLWCPGCGNTRAILALIDGDIIRAARCNAVAVALLLLLLVIYVRLLIGIEPLPKWTKKPLPWIVLGIIAALYYICRNFIPFLFIPT